MSKPTNFWISTSAKTHIQLLLNELARSEGGGDWIAAICFTTAMSPDGQERKPELSIAAYHRAEIDKQALLEVAGMDVVFPGPAEPNRRFDDQVLDHDTHRGFFLKPRGLDGAVA